ncbi:MAG: PQQ-dependent sugar dehydrogenase [Desulfobacteraceae bacterium]
MPRSPLPIICMFIAYFLSLFFLPPAAASGLKVKMMLSTIEMPPGFTISIYADNVPGARSLALSPSGVLFVGTRQTGKVYAVVDTNQDKKADRVITIADGLDMPNGVAFWEGDLYVAEVHRILRYRQIESQMETIPKPVVVYDQFPRDRHHGWKFIRFGPQGRLYVPVGAPCNVCLKKNEVYASITRMNRDGSGLEIYAHGVRNTVGFDWHPQTGEMWFTDNGRDWLGEDQPPDELNHVQTMGQHFGFPYCHGDVLGDPEFGAQNSCDQFTQPAALLDAHVAPLGMRFYTGRMFPKTYHSQIFIAEHGSWNRSRKIGYRITLVRVQGGRAFGYETFARGWRIGNSAWGRPVDVEVMSDGSLLVSDDKNGVIYRIHWQPADS